MKICVRRLPRFIGRAKKLQDNGFIRYCLWLDSQGKVYVQFQENEVETDDPGSFASLLYRVSDYEESRHGKSAISAPKGFNMETENWVIAEGTNNPGFLKAVLRDLLPTNQQEKAEN